MHPAPSLIFFTVASGAGFGMLALLGGLGVLGGLPASPSFALAALGLALALASAGLLASFFHLGHPERAWRAFSQWRSSWLSREGVVAVAAYVPALLFAFAWLDPLGDGGADAALAILLHLSALALAALALATLCCTAMIYATLKPVRQWCDGLVPPVFLALGLATGAAWLYAVSMLTGTPAWILLAASVVAIALAGDLKRRYWKRIDAAQGESSAESATGLGGLGAVRLLDPPHTGENYLLKEMGYRVARKHAARLRRLAGVLFLAVPLPALLLSTLSAGWPGAMLALLAAVSASTGTVIERWLFFAQATHTVTLYYGASRA